MVLFQHDTADMVVQMRWSVSLESGEFQWTRDRSFAASSAWCSNAEKWRVVSV